MSVQPIRLPAVQPIRLPAVHPGFKPSGQIERAISGLLADRFGTRASLRLLILAALFAPLLAIGLADLGTVKWYWITFFWIGLVPVTIRMLMNYTIEIVHRGMHPAYISTVNLCMAVPFLLSPLVGGFVNWFGHKLPFLGVSAVIAVAAVLTWTMQEPRVPAKVE